jgi:hypothetical protein
MKKTCATLNWLTGFINRSTKRSSKFVSKIWEAHQEFMSENPSYRELFDLAITTGIRLFRLSPIAALAISSVLAGFTERSRAWG